MPPRTILHLDLDAFFASVEQARHPEYRGKPVIVGGTSQRGVVSAASYEARRFGVRSAMPMWEARRRCPQAIFLPVDMKTYAEYSRRALEIISRYSPRLDPASVDEAYVDVTGSLRLFGDLGSICASIKRDIAGELGVTLSIGAAPNCLVAKMASEWDKPDGLSVVRPEELPERLHPLPVATIPGVGEATRQRLLQMGIESIGELSRVPRMILEQHFGKQGAYLYRAARGRDDRSVGFYRLGEDARRQISREETLARDTRDLEVLELRLLRLCEEVGRSLRAQGRRAKTVTLKVKLSDFKLFTRSTSLKAPTELDEVIFEATRRMLRGVQFGAQRARLIGVAVSNLTEGSGPGQLSLFDAEPSRLSDLARARDAIAARFGPTALTRARLVYEPTAS